MISPEIPINEPLTLPKINTWPETRHVFDEASAWAIKTAWAANRPLLLRGEPGTGKSQLARAAAHVLKRQFVSEVVQARSSAQDLHWHFDAIARLGEAQALGNHSSKRQRQQQLAYNRYITPGVLWWVFDWTSAKRQNDRTLHPCRPPIAPPNWQAKHGSVLLLDEIDKADSDLPNALLETLGNGAFNVPHLHKNVGLCEDAPPPLILISTNEERELPPAFVRRCMVLNFSLPTKEAALRAWLVERGRVHFADTQAHPDSVLQKAAELLWTDRRDALAQSLPPPGQAEYLDLLRAVFNLATDEASQLKLLNDISHYALHKNQDATA